MLGGKRPGLARRETFLSSSELKTYTQWWINGEWDHILAWTALMCIPGPVFELKPWRWIWRVAGSLFLANVVTLSKSHFLILLLVWLFCLTYQGWVAKLSFLEHRLWPKFGNNVIFYFSCSEKCNDSWLCSWGKARECSQEVEGECTFYKKKMEQVEWSSVNENSQKRIASSTGPPARLINWLELESMIVEDLEFYRTKLPKYSLSWAVFSPLKSHSFLHLCLESNILWLTDKKPFWDGLIGH